LLDIALHACSSKLTLFLVLAELDGMSISEEGDCSGVLGILAALSLGGIGFSPKGSSRNCCVSSAPVSSKSLGGVGGRTERDSNLDETMAMLKSSDKKRKQIQSDALAWPSERVFESIERGWRRDRRRPRLRTMQRLVLATRLAGRARVKCQTAHSLGDGGLEPVAAPCVRNAQFATFLRQNDRDSWDSPCCKQLRRICSTLHVISAYDAYGLKLERRNSYIPNTNAIANRFALHILLPRSHELPEIIARRVCPCTRWTLNST